MNPVAMSLHELFVDGDGFCIALLLARERVSLKDDSRRRLRRSPHPPSSPAFPDGL